MRAFYRRILHFILSLFFIRIEVDAYVGSGAHETVVHIAVMTDVLRVHLIVELQLGNVRIVVGGPFL